MACYLLKVAVDNTTFNFNDTYTYKNGEYVEELKRVIVPFGVSNGNRKGIVLGCTLIDDTTILSDVGVKDITKIKNIIRVIDSEAITSEMWKLIEYVSEKTLSTYYDVAKLVLPKGIDGNVTIKYNIVNENARLTISKEIVKDNVLEYIKDKKGLLTFTYIKENKSTLEKLIEKNILEKEFIIKDKFKKEKLFLYGLKNADCGNIKLTKKQNGVVDLLREKGNLSYKEIYYFIQVTKPVIENLVKKDILAKIEEEVNYSREIEQNIDTKKYVLNKEQENSFLSIKNSVLDKKSDTHLLFGVTGSGKTVVYIKLIEYLLSLKKSVILLVPEIGLTPQMVNIFKGIFGGYVSLLHSSISNGERVKEYYKIKNSEVSIVIGTRSALFAPIRNLGAIIIDEEQDGSYYSDNAPRYSAKEVAGFRCKYNNAVLILGSATPSIETYYKAVNGKINLLTLNDRYRSSDLPKTLIVDMKEELKKGNITNLSIPLLDGIRNAIDNGDQSIILVNRRGYETSMCCMNCDEVVKCDKCTVPIVYHRANDRYMCHHCGYIGKYLSCYVCGAKEFINNGFGTQKIENEIRKYVDGAKILRVDFDTTSSKFSYNEYFNSFKDKKYNVMIGTQMVSKGFDFPDVTVVGILNVDSIISKNGYKGQEKMFSIITQAIGRGGRSDKKGIAIIQSIDAENDIIKISAEQNYVKFYNEEIKLRQTLLYPPFCAMCIISFKGFKEEKVIDVSKSFTNFLVQIAKNNKDIKIKVLGPLPYNIVMVNNNYRYKVIIKCINNRVYRDFLREVIKKFNKKSRDVSLWIDFNNDSEV